MNKETIALFFEMNKKPIIRVAAGVVGAVVGATIATVLTQDVVDLDVELPEPQMPVEAAE